MYSPARIFARAVIDPKSDKQLEYKDLISDEKCREVWMKSFTKELDQLAQGKCGYNGTNTIFFIAKNEMPAGRKATYGRIVYDYRPQNSLTIGGVVLTIRLMSAHQQQIL
eukprot:9310968-Ditylum_brightwellii.AAC.1